MKVKYPNLFLPLVALLAVVCFAVILVMPASASNAYVVSEDSTMTMMAPAPISASGSSNGLSPPLGTGIEAASLSIGTVNAVQPNLTPSPAGALLFQDSPINPAALSAHSGLILAVILAILFISAILAIMTRRNRHQLYHDATIGSSSEVEQTKVDTGTTIPGHTGLLHGAKPAA